MSVVCPGPFEILGASPADLDEIMVIERLCFASPWSRQVFIEEFNQDQSRLYVVRHHTERTMTAFINIWLVFDEVHVLNVATHPHWQRRGLGRLLLQHCIDLGRERGAQLVTLEVRRSNEAALALYQGLGFELVGTRQRYYENGEDALVMLLDLD